VRESPDTKSMDTIVYSIPARRSGSPADQIAQPAPITEAAAIQMVPV
jgi:hypothetical protein